MCVNTPQPQFMCIYRFEIITRAQTLASHWVKSVARSRGLNRYYSLYYAALTPIGQTTCITTRRSER